MRFIGPKWLLQLRVVQCSVCGRNSNICIFWRCAAHINSIIAFSKQVKSAKNFRFYCLSGISNISSSRGCKCEWLQNPLVYAVISCHFYSYCMEWFKQILCSVFLIVYVRCLVRRITHLFHNTYFFLPTFGIIHILQSCTLNLNWIMPIYTIYSTETTESSFS